MVLPCRQKPLSPSHQPPKSSQPTQWSKIEDVTEDTIEDQTRQKEDEELSLKLKIKVEHCLGEIRAKQFIFNFLWGTFLNPSEAHFWEANSQYFGRISPTQTSYVSLQKLYWGLRKVFLGMTWFIFKGLIFFPFIATEEEMHKISTDLVFWSSLYWSKFMHYL